MLPKIIKKAEQNTTEVVDLRPKKENPRNTESVDSRTQQAIDLLVKGGKSKAEALRKAGFSPGVVKNPKKVFGRQAVKDITDGIVAKLMAERDAVIEEMKNKRVGANYGTLSGSLRNLNHDIQLLTGGATDRVDLPISDEEKERLNKLVNKNQ